MFVLNVVASEPFNDTSGNNGGASGGPSSTTNYKRIIMKAKQIEESAYYSMICLLNESTMNRNRSYNRNSNSNNNNNNNRNDIMQRQDIPKVPTQLAPHPSSVTYNEYPYNIVMNESDPSLTASEEKLIL